MNTLVVGGTSGLGLELARSMVAEGEEPIITGRHDPNVRFAEYREFDLAQSNLPTKIGQFVTDLPPIKSLVYAAGFYQEGHITDLSDEQVDEMIDVGGRGLIFFTKKLLEKQDRLDELVTITSTSQWTPREYEPVYNFVKAGVGHYSHGQSLDPRIGKTLVVGTSGMDTEFWDGIEKDTSVMMRPEWVAARIMELRKRNVGYKFAKILGAKGELPKRVVTENREAKSNQTDWKPESESVAWQFLRMVEEEPNLNCTSLALKNGVDSSQISRAGRQLRDGGYVTKQKKGRMALWNITELGSQYLKQE